MSIQLWVVVTLAKFVFVFAFVFEFVFVFVFEFLNPSCVQPWVVEWVGLPWPNIIRSTRVIGVPHISQIYTLLCYGTYCYPCLHSNQVNVLFTFLLTIITTLLIFLLSVPGLFWINPVLGQKKIWNISPGDFIWIFSTFCPIFKHSQLVITSTTSFYSSSPSVFRA